MPTKECRPKNADDTANTDRVFWFNHGYIGIAGYGYEMVEEAQTHLAALGEKDAFAIETDYHYLSFDSIIDRATKGFNPRHMPQILSTIIDSCDTDMLKQFVDIPDNYLQSDEALVLWNATRWLCGEQCQLTDELTEKIASSSSLMRLQTAYNLAKAGHMVEAQQLYDSVVNDVVNDVPADIDERYIRLYALIWYLLQMGRRSLSVRVV